MTTLTRRLTVIGAAAFALGAAAIVAGVIATSRPVQAQPTSILAQQPPSSCACAPAVSIFGGGGPQIAHCQCGALNCAAATAAGGVTLQCAR